MTQELLDYISRRHLDKKFIEENCERNASSFRVPLRNNEWRNGWQVRYLTQNSDGLKSKTEYGSSWYLFKSSQNIDKNVLIVEWEIDFLTILPYAEDYCVIWLKWINNLSRCIRDLEMLKWNFDVYILVDNDFAADESIKRIPYTELHLYDVRGALNGYKDVNDAVCAGKLDMSAFPKRIVKLKPKPRKQFTRNDTLDTLEKIDRLPVMDVLESLFPEYKRRWTDSILEDWKETHWYKFSNRLNIVRDFSWKWRPEWWPYQIAKRKFWDSHLTFLYFKGKI